MKTIVIYGSTYGSTEKYAKEIGLQLNCSAVDSKEVKTESIDDYATVILGACILEAQIIEAALYQHWIESYPDKNWILFTVGLSNPALTDFNRLLRSNFKADILDKVRFYHFRGSIAHKRLSLMDTLSKDAISQHSSVDFVNLKQEEIDLLERYGTTLDVHDEQTITPLINYVKQLQQSDET
ncbi:flavodoxin domain-containing protein [Fundicoccus culcitae]|uniref:Flavodoxin domain-containing protein n=1 Tax=Fundicoccus culcitae TaxID=2969821 RepID=A0ABY5P265_9LACT|nr:flavodoxin domain-containing protein [Fundicoccus culcitae]UUX32798.1 flavodoxin domain-containing protein [Fundicoccus culcitae]